MTPRSRRSATNYTRQNNPEALLSTSLREGTPTVVNAAFTYSASAARTTVLTALFAAISSLSLPSVHAAEATDNTPAQPGSTQAPAPVPQVEVLRLVSGKPVTRRYPRALHTLLKTVDKRTSAKVKVDPIYVNSFATPELFRHPFVYVNFADRPKWDLSPREVRNLKRYLDNGGFIYIDAGITANFLRGNGERAHGQHHSYGAWEVTPALRKAFKKVFPQKEFQPLDRSHKLYDCFYSGLPDPEPLPDSVREFVVKEKWPEGTYSAVALRVDGRIAVLATPILAMGWGKDNFGNWSTNIAFRIRESAEGLSKQLKTAAYTGKRYKVKRADGKTDVVFCQKEAMPAWVKEPDGRWRVFRYYQSGAISRYAHRFYTRLGVNILVYTLTN